ncbi:MAG: hypothetical protein QOK16_3124 [Solirubrobacteraceae bacterium]|jgi:hypothetical protein|nr:hypothetical protein [Solirubrobacteraceae bacterium]
MHSHLLLLTPNPIAAIRALPAYGALLLRLLADLGALAISLYALYFRRHGRRDMVMVYGSFNVGLFAVLSVITVQGIGVGAGFGLFAILSIIRLRSEPFSNQEIGYFFIALVLGLINGIDSANIVYTLVLDAIVVGGVFFADLPGLLPNVRQRRLTLDETWADEDALKTVLSERLGLKIRDVSIIEIDYVRDVTLVDVRYTPRAANPELADIPHEVLRS